MANYKTVRVSKGKNGWGGPLELTPTNEKKYVISVTGGGIHPVAKEIARLSGAEVVDSFKNPVAKEETLVAVIDCGGTARCGTYPRLNIPTVNVKVMSPSGPLAKFMTDDIFVSGVTVNDIEAGAGQESDTELAKTADIEEIKVEEGSYRTVKVSKGRNGWGGPLELTPTETKKYVISVTGGGIHPVAKEIARLAGVEVVDSFKNPVDKEETLAAVIDCGGTARCGTYPRLGIPTVNVKVMSPSGPLAKFMTDDIFVSGVTVDDIELLNRNETVAAALETVEDSKKDNQVTSSDATADDNNGNNEEQKSKGIMGFIDKVAKGAGSFMNIMYQAGRDTIDTIIKNIIPFMAFVATLIGIINYTGIGEILANIFVPLANNLGGLIILGVITALPFLSPLLAPGAVIGAIIGTLVGNEIANGNIEMSIALPALFAINAQVGTDFIPVGLTLGEAKPETISVGAPAVLFSRVITGPLAVVIAYFMSFLL